MEKFKVGDKVYNKNDRIGVVKRVTPTGRLVVDFDGYEEKFRPDGSGFGDSVWYRSRVMPLTPEKERKIMDENTIRKCRVLFDNCKGNITVQQAESILKILEDGLK